MKKIVLLVSVLASALVLASCAQDTNQGPAAAPAPVQTTAHHHHHDLKGEAQ